MELDFKGPRSCLKDLVQWRKHFGLYLAGRVALHRDEMMKLYFELEGSIKCRLGMIGD